jgi:hypothetical protein
MPGVHQEGQRYFEDLADLVGLRLQVFSGGNERHHGGDGVTRCGAIQRQRAEHFGPRRAQADFLMGLA